MSAAFDCQAPGCRDIDCLPTRAVFVPTDDTYTVNPELHVGVLCIDSAIRWLEGQPFATGPAQIDTLSYLDGAA